MVYKMYKPTNLILGLFPDLSGIGAPSFQVRTKGGHEGNAVHKVDKSIERA